MTRSINSQFLLNFATTIALGYATLNLLDAFINTWHFSIWVDEVLTLRTIFYSPIKIILSLYNQGPKGFSTDYFPPAYYLIVHYLHQAGAYEFGIRLANNIFVFVVFIFIIKQMSTINARATALCFVMFISVSIYFLDLFRLIRPYTLYFCLQTCAVVSIYVGILNRNIKNIVIAGILNAISLYTHYAAIGNIIAEIGCFSIFWAIYKSDRKFLLQATLIFLASAALFIPWLPGYLNAVKSAATEFGPAQIEIGKIIKFIELTPGLFSYSKAVVAIFVLLALLGILLSDKRIVIITLAWGLTPGILIAINGHPLYIRHLVTFATCLLLLSSFAIAKLCDILGNKIAKLNPIRSIATVVLGFALSISVSQMTMENKARFYAAETAPYKSPVLFASLNFPKADLIFTENNDPLLNTVLRWYFGDNAKVTYSKEQQGDKNVLLFKQDSQDTDNGNSHLKRINELARMPGFMISGIRLHDSSPVVIGQESEVHKIEYSLSDFKVLEDAFSWKNILVDTQKQTLEPASRLEDAELVFQFRLPKRGKIHFSAELLGTRDAYTNDVLELLVGSDNVTYTSLPKTNSHETTGNRFSQNYTFEPKTSPEQLYVKVRLKPGMTVPCAVLNTLTFSFKDADDPCNSTTKVGSLSLLPASAAVTLPSAADFGQITNVNTGFTVHGPSETLRVIAPIFDDIFDLDRDLFLKSNLRIKRHEGCLTCDSEEPCQFTYFLNSPKKLNFVKIIFYPRIFNDKHQTHYVKLAYSYDGTTFNHIWTTQNDKSLTHFCQREEVSIPLKGDVRNLFLRFEMHSEGSQVFSFGNRVMYIITGYSSDEFSGAVERQAERFNTVKRLLGI